MIVVAFLIHVFLGVVQARKQNVRVQLMLEEVKFEIKEHEKI